MILRYVRRDRRIVTGTSAIATPRRSCPAAVDYLARRCAVRARALRLGDVGPQTFELAAAVLRLELAQLNPSAARASSLLSGFGLIGLAIGAGLGAATLGIAVLSQGGFGARI